MTSKKNQTLRQAAILLFNFVSLISLISISTTEIWAQVRSAPPAPATAQTEDSTLWYVLLSVLVLVLAGVVWWWRKSRQAQSDSVAASKLAEKIGNDSDMNSFDGDKELEWLRKNRKIVSRKNQTGSTPRPVSMPKVNTAAPNEVKLENSAANDSAENALPIFSIERLEAAHPFANLPISDDQDLLSAVEQGCDEFEEDEEVRELAVRILAAFKKRNSVETLSQIALYDLSSNLRSKAVSVLSEFDHESVFEAILLANADPTREVRAAAARGLTKLTFDRADAWTLISETDEDGRIRQSARAAMESGFVDMSFDRLVSQDRKQAYEAFALMALLIKAGEIEKIMNVLETHRDLSVRRAILHIIKVIKDQKALDGLCALLEKNSLPVEFQEEVDKTIEEIGFVTA
ncbi:MAG: hypothetical protein LH614_08810 [Pyrinomonadaceae bacterium]|nr:hypothetical protein [Pyrinomonadaceae bacterium]